jgi:hypothetical protein
MVPMGVFASRVSKNHATSLTVPLRFSLTPLETARIASNRKPRPSLERGTDETSLSDLRYCTSDVEALAAAAAALLIRIGEGEAR